MLIQYDAGLHLQVPYFPNESVVNEEFLTAHQLNAQFEFLFKFSKYATPNFRSANKFCSDFL